MKHDWRMTTLPDPAHPVATTGGHEPATAQPPVHLLPLRIGSLSLSTPLLMAPMAGYSDLPFRRLVREQGGLGLAFTEMLNPNCVIRKKSKRAREILATATDDQPLGYQLYGTDPTLMREAAIALEAQGAVLIDINMGCPQRKISSRGAGAALALAAAVCQSVHIPVTVKMRLGWDHESHVAAELTRQMAGIGIAAVTIHGRTRGQGYMGNADLDAIGAVVVAGGSMPVIGNGDILTPLDAVRMLQVTGCAGLMLGRGIMRNPCLMRDTLKYLQGLPPDPAPTLHNCIALALRHLDGMVALYGPDGGALLFRKWIPFYASGLRLKKPAMVALLQIAGLEKLKAALVSHGGLA